VCACARYLLPVGVVCGYFLGLLYTSSSPSPSAFGAFAVSAVTLGAWYAYHAFGHLLYIRPPPPNRHSS
jgi:hypothetical protein